MQVLSLSSGQKNNKQTNYKRKSPTDVGDFL
jgi:hypothetical protein